MLFHSPLGVLFTFPSRYLFTIGQQGVLSLGGWSPQIPSGFHVSEGTQEHHRWTSAFAYGGITLYASTFQSILLAVRHLDVGPTTPHQKPDAVWAIPRSLAATDGVSFDFLSCGYLDVSVPRVGLPFGITRLCALGFPIRASPVHRLLASSPKLFAGSYALHRLLLPRHPPHALSSLISPKRSDAPFGALDVLRRWTPPSTSRLPFPFLFAL